METQKYCSVRVSGPKNQNGGFPQNLPGRFTSVCSVRHWLARYKKIKQRKPLFEVNIRYLLVR